MIRLDAVHGDDLTSALNEQCHVFGVMPDDVVRVLVGRLKVLLSRTIAHKSVRIAIYVLMNVKRDDVVREGCCRTVYAVVPTRLA